MGTYCDRFFVNPTRWPSTNLQVLSTVHDPLDVPALPAQGAPAALVFSHPYYLKSFVSQENLERINLLRLRLTGMDVMHV
jgi:hypothetical protein